MSKTIIYIRTSTGDQNPENQIKDCKSMIKEEFGDYEILEDKQSAFKDFVERDSFEKVKSRIKNHNTNHLIVWDWDRIYRDRIQLKAFFELCKFNKVKIHSFRQNWLETLNNIPSPWDEIMYDLFLQILGWLAEEESIKKSERVKIATRKKEGITYSYKGNKWGRKSISTQKKNKINELLKNNPKITIRDISKELSLSIGVVHKYVSLIKGKNKIKSDVQDLVKI